jgi:uncharacterized protein (DUF488 family)
MSTESRPSAIYTVGHSTRSADEFVALLTAHHIRRLVDVRTIPRSRHNPQFNSDRLPDTLRQASIEYVHMAALGGLRRPRPDSINLGWRNESFRGYADYMQTEEFSAALEQLIAVASSALTAIMCAEAVPWRCHRSLVADALVVRGIEALEIMSTTRATSHTLTSFARIHGVHLTYPAEGLQL